MRNTDSDWNAIGLSDPYYGVITDEKFRRENMDAEKRAEFFASGKTDIDFVLSKVPVGIHMREALDFGCGVGRLSLALTSHFEAVTGVDVSEGMLNEARSNAATDNIRNVAFVNRIPDKAFDLITSYIVFQHIPPAKGMDIFRTLLSRVKIGGAIAIQMIFYRLVKHTDQVARDHALVSYDGETLKSRSRRYLDTPNQMMMYDYDATDVLVALFEAGFPEFTITKTDHGSIGAWVFAKRVT
jgi:trans-aconitate methyltransferase